MKPLRAAVIGVGYLGRFHAEKYAALPEAELVAVVDTDTARGGEVAERLGCGYHRDYQALGDDLDVVSIVVPTPLHHRVARHFLERDVHVLVEKPITTTLEEADELVELAARRDLCLQVGHLERFNSAVEAMAGLVTTPMFIESNRLAPFTPRGSDVSVVMDLMIHDIDIILNLVGEPVERIDANGIQIISGDIDIANARIKFANGCVANVTASRVSMKRERKMRLFQPNAYISLDFQNCTLEIRRKAETEQHPGIPDIRSETIELDNGDALRNEIAAFLACVRSGGTPVVSGREGREALATAIEITRQLSSSPIPGGYGK
jgi:predicted dehydrogenase